MAEGFFKNGLDEIKKAKNAQADATTDALQYMCSYIANSFVQFKAKNKAWKVEMPKIDMNHPVAKGCEAVTATYCATATSNPHFETIPIPRYFFVLNFRGLDVNVVSMGGGCVDAHVFGSMS